jgi:hypothetical protein
MVSLPLQIKVTPEITAPLKGTVTVTVAEAGAASGVVCWSCADKLNAKKQHKIQMEQWTKKRENLFIVYVMG